MKYQLIQSVEAGKTGKANPGSTSSSRRKGTDEKDEAWGKGRLGRSIKPAQQPARHRERAPTRGAAARMKALGAYEELNAPLNEPSPTTTATTPRKGQPAGRERIQLATPLLHALAPAGATAAPSNSDGISNAGLWGVAQGEDAAVFVARFLADQSLGGSVAVGNGCAAPVAIRTRSR